MVSKALQRASSNLRRKGPFLRGLLGDFDGTMAVADRPGYYYVRIEKPGGYEVGIFPGRVRQWYNLPVRVETHPITKIQYIAGVDDELLAYSGVDPSTVPNTEPHGSTHDWGGDDMVMWLHTNQLFQLRCQPHETTGTSVVIQAGSYTIAGVFYVLAEPLEVDLSSYYPTLGTDYVTVGLDTDEAASVTATGTTGIAGVSLPANSIYAIAAVRLVAGASVGWQDIIDARFVHPGPDELDDLTDVTITSAARGDILTRGATEWGNLALGASGTVLTSDGTDAEWAAAGGAYTGGDGIAISGADVISVDRDSTWSGLAFDTGALTVDLTEDFTWTGEHTFQDEVLIEGADSTAKFQVDRNSGGTMLAIDSTNNRVGLGTDSPASTIHFTSGGTLPTLPTGGTEAFILQSNAASNSISRFSIIAGSSGASAIDFGDSADYDVARISYYHPLNTFQFFAGAVEQMRLTTVGLGIRPSTWSLGSRLWIETAAAASIGMIIKGYTSQTGMLMKLTDVSNNELFGVLADGAIEMVEQTAPSAGAANTVRLYAEDDGAGKTRLMALFNSGAAQQIAIEP